jgi:hypothetical protein
LTFYSRPTVCNGNRNVWGAHGGIVEGGIVCHRASALSRISRHSNLYGCPICTRLLPAEALNSHDLTLEHVPPRALGGRGIALTCKSCNNDAGSTVDAAVHRRESFFELGRNLRGRPGEFTGPVKIEAGGVVTNAVLLTKDGQVTIKVDRRKNNPILNDEQIAKLEAELNGSGSANFRLNVSLGFSFDRSRVGDLKSAYLAALAMFGYRYAYSQPGETGY